MDIYIYIFTNVETERGRYGRRWRAEAGEMVAGKWELQVQNVNKRAPEGMLIYIYKPNLFVMEIKPPLPLPHIHRLFARCIHTRTFISVSVYAYNCHYITGILWYFRS